MTEKITKIFKKGEYYQTFELKLVLWYDKDNNVWLYKTHYRKSNKDDWKVCHCIVTKIKTHINKLINNSLEPIKNSEIKEVK